LATPSPRINPFYNYTNYPNNQTENSHQAATERLFSRRIDVRFAAALTRFWPNSDEKILRPAGRNDRQGTDGVRQIRQTSGRNEDDRLGAMKRLI
jgi:hypothetical protein